MTKPTTPATTTPATTPLEEAVALLRSVVKVAHDRLSALHDGAAEPIRDDASPGRILANYASWLARAFREAAVPAVYAEDLLGEATSEATLLKAARRQREDLLRDLLGDSGTVCRVAGLCNRGQEEAETEAARLWVRGVLARVLALLEGKPTDYKAAAERVAHTLDSWASNAERQEDGSYVVRLRADYVDHARSVVASVKGGAR